MNKLLMAVAAALLVFPGLAQSATIIESWSFSALFETNLARDQANEPWEPSTTEGRLIREGLAVGQVYDGLASIEWDSATDRITSASCYIGVLDCWFGNIREFSYNISLPFGPEAWLQLGLVNEISSGLQFTFEPTGYRGTYEYLDSLTPGNYSSWSQFQLSNVNYTVSSVPLPAALPLLAAGLAGLGFIGRRRKHEAT